MEYICTVETIENKEDVECAIFFYNGCGLNDLLEKYKLEVKQYQQTLSSNNDTNKNDNETNSNTNETQQEIK